MPKNKNKNKKIKETDVEEQELEQIPNSSMFSNAESNQLEEQVSQASDQFQEFQSGIEGNEDPVELGEEDRQNVRLNPRNNENEVEMRVINGRNNEANVAENQQNVLNRQNEEHGENLQNRLNESHDAGNEGNPNIEEESFFKKNSRIIKVMMVLMMMIFVLWISSTYFLPTFIKTRQPMFLSNFDFFSSAPEVISPQESDYKSYQYYEKFEKLARTLNDENRDPTPEELAEFDPITFKEFYNSYKVIRIVQLSKEFSTSPTSEKIDINETNLDQPINRTDYFMDAANQFGCGSCYSFPIAATVEYLYKFKYNISIKLSEQQLIDCAHGPEQSNGCEDGNITKGFEYVRDVGLVSTEEYPYRSITGNSYKCDTQTIGSNNKYKISGFRTLPQGNCQAIQAELVKGNVVAAMINAGELSRYTDGTFTDCKRYGLNHAITIVGQTEKNEWIVRNSWGKSWGNNGYFVMGYGNSCGVCSFAIVPVLNIENGIVLPYDPKKENQKENNEK